VDGEVHPDDDPPTELAVALAATVPAWLERCVIVTAARLDGTAGPQLRADAVDMAAAVGPVVVERLRVLLATDVDEQAANLCSCCAPPSLRRPTSCGDTGSRRSRVTSSLAGRSLMTSTRWRRPPGPTSMHHWSSPAYGGGHGRRRRCCTGAARSIGDDPVGRRNGDEPGGRAR
jgi:hypothetical protein